MTIPQKYILDNQNVVIPATDAQWVQSLTKTSKFHIKIDKINGFEINTQFNGRSINQLFEITVNYPIDNLTRSYLIIHIKVNTHSGAVIAHKSIVAEIKEHKTINPYGSIIKDLHGKIQINTIAQPVASNPEAENYPMSFN